MIFTRETTPGTIRRGTRAYAAVYEAGAELVILLGLLAAAGISLGGYLAPRAASGEQFPGVVGRRPARIG